jgi:hypothetical protein
VSANDQPCGAVRVLGLLLHPHRTEAEKDLRRLGAALAGSVLGAAGVCFLVGHVRAAEAKDAARSYRAGAQL